MSDGLLWVLMITSAENRGWPGDVAVAGAATGLPVGGRRIGHTPVRPRSAVLGLLRDWLNQTADER